MKASRIFIVIGFAMAIAALIWQARTIAGLRAEISELRNDLQTALDTASTSQPGLSPSAEQARRESLELVKLRNQVRELKESLVESHAKERSASAKAVLHLLFPGQAIGGPWKIRPEWKGMEASVTNQYAQAMKTLNSTTNDFAKFLAMDRAAKMSLAVGRTEDARKIATDMLALDDKYSRGIPEKANGDVTYDGHLVLGRIAVDEGHIEDANQHLLAAGRSTGSPVLDSFGPNMTLARDLLEKGQQEAVLEYLESCRKFWPSGGEKLDQWIKDIHAGRIPDFGANLIY